MLKCQFTKKLQNTNAQIISKEKYINSKNDMNKRTVAPKWAVEEMIPDDLKGGQNLFHVWGFLWWLINAQRGSSYKRVGLKIFLLTITVAEMLAWPNSPSSLICLLAPYGVIPAWLAPLLVPYCRPIIDCPAFRTSSSKFLLFSLATCRLGINNY